MRSFLDREHNEIVLKIKKQMVELRHKNNLLNLLNKWLHMKLHLYIGEIILTLLST